MINIRARVNHLIQKYETRNPEKLAKELGIIVMKKGFNSQRTKGFFVKELGKKFIVINLNLDERSQSIVMAHELGHALLHSTKQTYYIHEYTLFPRGRIEIEANKFAAQLLVDEQDIDKQDIKGMSINQLACYFHVPERLVIYKFFE